MEEKPTKPKNTQTKVAALMATAKKHVNLARTLIDEMNDAGRRYAAKRKRN